MTNGDPVDALERELDDLAAMVEDLRATRLDGTWLPSKERVDAQLASTQLTVSNAAQRGGNADARARIERAMSRVEELARRVKQIPAPVACEAAIMEIMLAPLTGGATAGFAHKEAQLRAELAELSHLDSRLLAARIRNASPDDPLTPLFQRWTAERRSRLTDFLDDSRRREALRREAELRNPRKG